jgi:hypothetical protein
MVRKGPGRPAVGLVKDLADAFFWVAHALIYSHQPGLSPGKAHAFSHSCLRLPGPSMPVGCHALPNCAMVCFIYHGRLQIYILEKIECMFQS